MAQVFQHDPAWPWTSSEIGMLGPANGQLYAPNSAAVDSLDNTIVLDSGNNLEPVSIGVCDDQMRHERPAE